MVPGTGESSIGEAIEQIDARPSSTVVAELLVARDRLEARLSEALSGFLGRGLHQVEGWSSPVGWLKAHGVGDRDAKLLAVRSARLTAWPELARRWYTGEVTGAQVDVVVSLIPRPLVDLYAGHDAEVSPYLVGLSPVDTARAIREWVARAEAVTAAPDVEPGAGGAGRRPRVHLSRTLDGSAVVDAVLDADTAALAETALRIAERPDRPGEFRTAAERRGDAFGRVMRFFCDHAATLGDRPGRQHPHVAVTIDATDLVAGALRGLGIRTAADLERFLAVRDVGVFEEGVYRDALAHAAGTPITLDGHQLSAASLSRLFDRGTLLHRLLVDDGVVVDRGRTLRLASPNLRDALLARDQGCRFPHCDAPTEWTHAHHLHHWEHGGPTDLANLVGLCATHHGVVHRHGWSLLLRDDGDLVFTRPDGETLTSPPPRRRRFRPLPLHHPGLRDVIPPVPGPPVVDPETDDPETDDPEPDDAETDRLTRRRVVDLVRHHRRRTDRGRPEPPPTWTWPEAG